MKEQTKKGKKQRKKALHKDFLMEIRNTKSRFISIFLIVALGVAFYAGVRACEPDMKYSADKMYDNTGFFDVRLISTLGITEKEVEKISTLDCVEKIAGISSIDVLAGSEDAQTILKVWAYNDIVNVPLIQSGEIPKAANECIVDVNYFENMNLAIGDRIAVRTGNETPIEESLTETEFVITGTFISSMYLNFDKGTTTIGNGQISGAIMVPQSAFATDIYTEVYLTVVGAKDKVAYTEGYDKLVDDVTHEIEACFDEANKGRYADLEIEFKEQFRKDFVAEFAKGFEKEFRIEFETAFREEFKANFDKDFKKKFDAEFPSKFKEEFILQMQAVYGPMYDILTFRYFQDEYEAAMDEAYADAYKEAYNEAYKSYDELYMAAFEENYDEAFAAELETYSDVLEASYTEELSKINIADYLPESEIYVLKRSSVVTYVEFEQDTERIGKIGQVIPLIFFIVAALVSLTTMTRMVEEQRTQIGMLKALGYSKWSIAGKYIGYALLATVLGSLIGGAIGVISLPYIVLNAYKILYENLCYIVITPAVEYWATAFAVSVGCVVLATIMACFKELVAAPAVLMRPVAPKAGKRVLLERIPFIWKRLNFSRKSTIRNLFRYKKRLFMTLFGIGGCMSLLMVGFGLSDSINAVITNQYGEITHYDMVVSIDKNATEQQLEEMYAYLSEKEGIESYLSIRNGSGTLSYNDKSSSTYIYVTDDTEKFETYFTLRHRDDKSKVHMEKNGVVITEKMAAKLGISIGDTVMLKISDTVMAEVKVTEIVENYVYHNVYMSKELYTSLFGEAANNEILLSFNETGIAGEKTIAEELLAMEAGAGTTYIDAMKSKFAEMLDTLDIIVVVVVVAAGALAFVVLYNLNNINITERKRELATLKVLGFYDGEVSQYIFRENIIITIGGIILGVFGGIFLHKYVITTIEVDMVMFGRDMSVVSALYSILITLIFSLIVNVFMHFKLKKVDMATSLKSAE